MMRKGRTGGRKESKRGAGGGGAAPHKKRNVGCHQVSCRRARPERVSVVIYP